MLFWEKTTAALEHKGMTYAEMHKVKHSRSPKDRHLPGKEQCEYM